MNDNWGFSDEDLDGLFRQAAEGQRPRFEPEDWRHMAARLDEAGRDGVLPPTAVPWYRRWGWLVLAGVLLLTGLAVWMVAVQKQVGSTQEPVMPVPQAESATEGASSARHSEGKASAPTEARASDRLSEPGAASSAAGSVEPAGESVASGLRVSEKAAHPRGEEVADAERKTAPGGGETPGAETVSAKSEKKSVEGGRHLSQASAGQGRATPTDRAEAVAGKVISPKKEPRRVPTNAAPDRAADLAPPTRTAPPNRRAREIETAPVVVKAGRRNSEPGGTKPRTLAVRTADAGEQPGSSNQDGATSPLSPVTANALPAEPERWQTPDLAPLNSRRVLFRKINLPVEEPGLSQFSTYYTPPVRRAEVPPRGRFGVRVLLAPDLNAVTRMQTFAVGRSFGILAEYEFIPRWRVQAGAIRSQKDYGSTPDDYTPPTPGYWARWGRPETIDARCAILDVPLNVRFDALRRPRHDLFVSTGLSTYVMLDEAYDYHYANKPPYTHEVYRGGRHLASTLNLSAGYERQLGAGFSLQVEPYLKLPLAGVGWGSVRLYSTGLHLSLGFHRVR